MFVSFLDLEGILDQLGKNPALVNEAVLIGCTEQNVAQFSLDVGKSPGGYSLTSQTTTS